MEAATKEVISGTDYGGGVREEKRYESSTGCEEGWKKETTVFEVRNWRPCHENYLKPASSPLQKDSSSCSKQDLQLQSTRAKMIEAREENERLTKYLDRIMKDYHNLQMKFFGIVKKEGRKTTDNTDSHQQIEETGTFLSLHLGTVPPRETNDQKKRIVVSSQLKVDSQAKEVLSLGLDCRSFELSKSKVVVSRFEELKEDARETSWLPSKVLKTMRSGDDEFQRQNRVKKARVSVRARCDTPTMNDGCQWRKYGQKTAKGHPCPRAYYRCNVSPSCPVRKQVQRCAEDISILITTYEGTHNHLLPMSATLMASTTSAAASMFLSDSSGSQLGHSSPASTITSSPTANLHGLNIYETDNLKSKHFYLSNSLFSSSSIPSHPTITLDLTSSPSSSLPHFNKVSSEYCPSYSSSSLNFKSSNSDAKSWVNGFFNYGRQPYNKNQIGNLSMRRQPVEDIYQSYTQKKDLNPQHSLLETIDVATKASTVDQSFQSA